MNLKRWLVYFTLLMGLQLGMVASSYAQTLDLAQGY